MYIPKALNKYVFIICSSFLLMACRSAGYFISSDPNYNFKNETCNLQDKISASTLHKFQKNKIIASKKDVLQMQVLFKGKNNAAVVLVNCNAAFQAPKFLAFYENGQLKVIVNTFDLELLYKEYRSFCKAAEMNAEDSKKIWQYISSFVDQQLIDKYNKVNW